MAGQQFAELETALRHASREAAINQRGTWRRHQAPPAASSVPLHNGTFRHTVIPSASGQVLPYNAERRYLLVQNKGTAVVYLGVGIIPTADSGIQLAASGGSYELIYWVPANPIYVIGAQPIIVIEG